MPAGQEFSLPRPFLLGARELCVSRSGRALIAAGHVLKRAWAEWAATRLDRIGAFGQRGPSPWARYALMYGTRAFCFGVCDIADPVRKKTCGRRSPIGTVQPIGFNQGEMFKDEGGSC